MDGCLFVRPGLFVCLFVLLFVGGDEDEYMVVSL